MQPTDQTAIPWNFLAGDISTEGSELVWPTAFTAVVTGISLGTSGSVELPFYVLLQDGFGASRGLFNLAQDDVAPYALAEDLFIVLGTESGAKLSASAAGAYGSCDGWLCVPSSASLIPDV